MHSKLVGAFEEACFNSLIVHCQFCVIAVPYSSDFYVFDMKLDVTHCFFIRNENSQIKSLFTWKSYVFYLEGTLFKLSTYREEVR